MPMQMVVIILGPHRDGKRHSPFTKGLLHPRSHKLRFRKKSQSTSSEFKETWERVWREDRAEILPHQWLEAMIREDGVLKEHLFVVDIPVPDESRCKELLEMAERKLKDGLERSPEFSRPPTERVLLSRSMSICSLLSW
jgi:hypothetical protein